MESTNKDINDIVRLNESALRLAEKSDDLRKETEKKIDRAKTEFRVLVGLVVVILLLSLGISVIQFQQSQRNSEVLELVQSVTTGPTGQFYRESSLQTSFLVDMIIRNQHQDRADILQELADIRTELGLPPSSADIDRSSLEYFEPRQRAPVIPQSFAPSSPEGEEMDGRTPTPVPPPPPSTPPSPTDPPPPPPISTSPAPPDEPAQSPTPSNPPSREGNTGVLDAVRGTIDGTVDTVDELVEGVLDLPILPW